MGLLTVAGASAALLISSSVSTLISRCPVEGSFMNIAPSAGFITIATKSEDERPIMTVMGRYFMNSPIIPVQNRSGKNAASVVRVEDTTAGPTSTVALTVACSLGTPCSMKRYMFSTMTMASSTTRPITRVREKSTIMLSVMPMELSVIKVINIEKGIAMLTRMAFLMPITKKRTATTSIKPVIM